MYIVHLWLNQKINKISERMLSKQMLLRCEKGGKYVLVGLSK